MRYNPNPTFLTKATKIRKNRHTKIAIFIVVAVFLALITIFVIWGAKMQEKYRKMFPNMVGAANTTPTTLDLSFGKHTESTETDPATETSETLPEETMPAPVIMQTTESTTEVTETTQQVNTPSVFEEGENYYFKNSYSLQTISHEERDVKLDVLKQNIIDYQKNNPNMKISFSYINLKSNETMGINDLEPIIPGGSWALPETIAFLDMEKAGTISDSRVVTYKGESPTGMSSYIADTYTSGKQFYMRTILNYAVAKNDSIALDYIITAIGGIESSWAKISPISSYINFTESVIYTDYTGVQQRGNYRTSTYDMAMYMKYLYFGYLNSPSVYQPLINDLYYSEVATPYTTVFENSDVLHISGRNEMTHSYIDAAIIDGDEPYIVIISVETSSYDNAQIATADLSTYLYRYISSCHQA